MPKGLKLEFTTPSFRFISGLENTSAQLRILDKILNRLMANMVNCHFGSSSVELGAKEKLSQKGFLAELNNS